MDTNREIITHTDCQGKGCEGCNYQGRIFMNGDKLAEHEKMTDAEACSKLHSMYCSTEHHDEDYDYVLQFITDQEQRITELESQQDTLPEWFAMGMEVSFVEHDNDEFPEHARGKLCVYRWTAKGSLAGATDTELEVFATYISQGDRWKLEKAGEAE